MLGPRGGWTALPQRPVSPQFPPSPYASGPHAEPGGHSDNSRGLACLRQLAHADSGVPLPLCTEHTY